jgi:transcriptional regulator with XRE-family HTH domain
MNTMIIAKLRRQREWTQAELARRARLHPTTVSMAERGRLLLGQSQLKKLARAFGVPAVTLLEDQQVGVGGILSKRDGK